VLLGILIVYTPGVVIGVVRVTATIFDDIVVVLGCVTLFASLTITSPLTIVAFIFKFKIICVDERVYPASLFKLVLLNIFPAILFLSCSI